MRNNGDDAVGRGTTSATLPGRSPSPQTDDADARLTADPAMIVPGIDATEATAAAEARASLEAVGAAHRKRQRAGAVAAIALLVVVAAGVSIAVVFSSRGSHGVDVPEVSHSASACCLASLTLRYWCVGVCARNSLARSRRKIRCWPSSSTPADCTSPPTTRVVRCWRPKSRMWIRGRSSATS